MSTFEKIKDAHMGILAVYSRRLSRRLMMNIVPMTSVSERGRKPDRGVVTRYKFAAALTANLLCASVALAQPQVDIEFIGSFGSFGKSAPGTFDWPVAIAIDDQYRLIIADNDNHRVQRCDVQGNCEVWGKRGSRLGEFYWPLGAAVDSLGRIIISEAGNDRIQLRDTVGNWTSFGWWPRRDIQTARGHRGRCSGQDYHCGREESPNPDL